MVDLSNELIEDLQKKISLLEVENKQLKENEVDIEKAKELYLRILQDFPALIWRANTEKLCDYFNTTWLDFTGRTIEQEYGNGWAEGVHPDDLERCIEIYTSNFDQKKPFSMEYRLKNKNDEYRWVLDIGQPYFDLDSTFLGYIGSCYDITDKKEYEERLKALTITDSLTQIYNRLKLDSELQLEISRANRYGTQLSTILIDIDNFKSVNDTFGHQFGDTVIVKIAQILKDNIRSTDVLGRWGGEEFLIICPDAGNDSAVKLAEKLREAIERQEYPKVNQKTCSFGVSTYKKKDTLNTLLNRADRALYQSKNQGKNQVQSIENLVFI